jgi:hypothetical protein
MAFTHKFKAFDPTRGEVVAYNVDWPVGRGGSNVREDVMLIQALFKVYYWEITDIGEDLTPPPGESQIIEVDGWWGPTTQKYIEHFQAQVVAKGFNVLRDGLIDPYRDAPWTPSTISKSTYTLVVLVSRCHRLCEQNRETYYQDLPHRGDMPLRLRNALKTVKTRADKYR